MRHEFADRTNRLAKAHAARKADYHLRFRGLSMEERVALVKSACETAAVIRCSRAAAGMSPIQPAPWPASTREFFKRHAASVRK